MKPDGLFYLFFQSAPGILLALIGQLYSAEKRQFEKRLGELPPEIAK